MKPFALSGSGSFGRIRLRQTGPNPAGNNCLALSAFGAVARLPDDFVKFCFPTAPMLPFTWAPFNGVISYLRAKCGGNVHDRGVVEITASSVLDGWNPQNAADLGHDSYFCSEDKPAQ
jgi:hypothetical protein